MRVGASHALGRAGLRRVAWLGIWLGAVALPTPGLAGKVSVPAAAYQQARRGYYALKESTAKQKLRHHWLKVIDGFVAVATQHPRSNEAAAARYTAAELWRELYAISRKSSDRDAALRAYADVVRRHPRSTFVDDALYERARLLFAADRGEEALDDLETLLRSHPKGDRVRAARSLAKIMPSAPPSAPAPSPVTPARRSHAAAPAAAPHPEPASSETSEHHDGAGLKRLITTGLQDGSEASPGRADAAPRVATVDPEPDVPCPTGARRVVLDPGHGGHDTGAIGHGGVREKDVVLAIAKATARALRDQGICATLTRADDRSLSLAARTALANESSADAFVSIHANSHRSSTSGGVETYTLNLASSRYERRLAAVENAVGSGGDLGAILTDLANKASAPESAELAKHLHAATLGTARRHLPKIRDLGNKSALFFVLVGARMPAVLVETAFVSNPDEAKLLATPSYQEELAQALAAGLAKALAAPQVASAR